MKTITKIPCKCPICDGVGQVPGGYYNRAGVNEWASTTVAEVCRQCNGTGIIYGEQITEYEPCPA